MKIEDILLEQAKKKNGILVEATKELEFFRADQHSYCVSLNGRYTVQQLAEVIQKLNMVNSYGEEST